MPLPVANTTRLGRPRNDSAVSHALIMDAVFALLQETSARDLTMEAVAKRAGVGKPTLYKWWPSKSALVMAMFHERFPSHVELPPSATAEQALRARVRRLIREANGLFGKVMADLIAEGQSDPAILHELYEQHIRIRRSSTVADIERGKASGEFAPNTSPDLLVDALFAPIYNRLLLRSAPLTEKYGNDLIDQVLSGVRNSPKAASRKKS